MIIETKRVLAVAALIAVVGVASVELTRGTAQAGTAHEIGIADYSAARIAAAFEVVAEMPPVPEVRVPLAQKGDLPVPLDCVGTGSEAECMDVAYEVPSEPSVVVETRFGNTSTLMRLEAMTLADFADEEPLLRSE